MMGTPRQPTPLRLPGSVPGHARAFPSNQAAWLCVGFLALFSSSAQAARIAELSETEWFTQALRFFTFQDPALRYALLGSVLLGITCGVLGSFIVVRKMALMGDALSHAVLPGVAAGFLWQQSKDPVAIFVGATVAGLLGTALVNWIRHLTPLKEDTALGLVLATFFGVGICMMTMIQRLPTGNKSGIDKFLFGQAAAISGTDLQLMAVAAGLALVLVTVLYKEFLVTSFDAGFARILGFRVQVLHYLLMLLVAFAVVIALQAVGVVLVSAMLVTPAAAAYLLTDRLHRMLWLAGGFGLVAGALGCFLSFLGPNLPTGPFMVLGASAVFTLAFLFAPRHGLLLRWWRRRSDARRVHRENTLKSIYHVLESGNFREEGVSVEALAARRHESVAEARARARALAQSGLATCDERSGTIYVTPSGWQLARTIVRNHRLWELYLTNAVDIPADHVHEDAEKIEHVLGEPMVAALEKQLHYATHDPHGRTIPGVKEPGDASTETRPAEPPVGYRQKYD